MRDKPVENDESLCVTVCGRCPAILRSTCVAQLCNSKTKDKTAHIKSTVLITTQSRSFCDELRHNIGPIAHLLNVVWPFAYNIYRVGTSPRAGEDVVVYVRRGAVTAARRVEHGIKTWNT